MSQGIALKLAEELYNFQNRWKCKVGWYRPWAEIRPQTQARWTKKAEEILRRLGIMNNEEIARKRNDVARLFRQNSKIHRNCIRINSGSTIEHERKKFEMCWAMAKGGHEFLTEAETEDKSCRADIVDLDLGMIFEIVKTEGEASLASKAQRYPLPLKVVRI